MDDRRRTLAAIIVIVGFLLLVAVIVGLMLSVKKTVSPVPEEPSIRIIFISPTPPAATAASTLQLTPTP